MFEIYEPEIPRLVMACFIATFIFCMEIWYIIETDWEKQNDKT